VACWYGVDHIITNPDGTIAEHNSHRYRREHDPSWETQLEADARLEPFRGRNK
jgi:hypothetical protein